MARRTFDPLSTTVVHEPTAAERARGAQDELARHRRRRRRAKRRASARKVGLPVLAVVVVGAAAVVGLGRAGIGPAASRLGDGAADGATAVGPPPGTVAPAPLPPPTDIELVPPREYRVGDCVTWEPGPAPSGAKPAVIVPCAEPHRFEVTGEATVADVTAYPDDATWQRLIDERCAPAGAAYLGGPVDPWGPFPVDALQPTHRGWDRGDRHLWCGLQGVDPGPDQDPSTPVPTERSTQGSARDHPAWSFAPGTCVTVHRPGAVNCRLPHEMEITGTVELTADAALPSPDDHDGWAALVGGRCRTLATAYLHRSPREPERSGWYNHVRPESAAAGHRTVFCVVGTLDGEDWAPATGSLRDQSA